MNEKKKSDPVDEPIEMIVPRSKVSLSPSAGSIVALRDGRLMWLWSPGGADPLKPMMANYSTDGGRTWSDPRPMKLDSGAELLSVIGPSVKRLKSGPLAMTHRSDVTKGAHYLDRASVTSFHLSRDEGESWSAGVDVAPRTIHANREDTTVDGLVQLAGGRLLLPLQKVIGPTPTGQGGVSRFGQTFGDGRADNLWVSFVYYSDDEGRSWQRSRNEVFATIDRGAGGIYGLGEPQVVELADGRVLLIGRSSLGQPFRAWSDDGGESWQEAEPTGLAARIGPLTVERMPDSDDVLIIWNQLSPWEVMQGYYRHRISCALSSDGGVTWHHHRNLESLDDTDHIDPGPLELQLMGGVNQPLDRTRYHRAPGPLRLDHPYCTFHEGRAIIVYGYGNLGARQVIEQVYGMKYEQVGQRFGFEPNPATPNKVFGNNKMHILPLDWFYR